MEVDYGSHLLLPKTGARLILSLVQALHIPNRNGPFPIYLLYIHKYVLPFVNGGRLV